VLVLERNANRATNARTAKNTSSPIAKRPSTLTTENSRTAHLRTEDTPSKRSSLQLLSFKNLLINIAIL
jgi:hypothetical protein